MEKLYITVCDPENGDPMNADLPPRFAEDADRYKKERDRELSLACRGLLAAHLKKQGVDPYSCVLKRTGQGKPYLEGGEVCFSFSHSGCLAVLLVSDRSCGVDLERVDACRHSDALARRLFSKKEQEDYNASEDKALFFTSLWTKKEAVGKCIGSGIFPDSMKELNVSNCASALLSYGGERYCLSVSVDGRKGFAGEMVYSSEIRLISSLN